MQSARPCPSAEHGHILTIGRLPHKMNKSAKPSISIRAQFQLKFDPQYVQDLIEIWISSNSDPEYSNTIVNNPPLTYSMKKFSSDLKFWPLVYRLLSEIAFRFMCRPVENHITMIQESSCRILRSSTNRTWGDRGQEINCSYKWAGLEDAG